MLITINPEITVATHSGQAHADDVCSVAVLRLIDNQFQLIRTRDPGELAAATIRIDVGNKYDPATGDFDHHQEGFEMRHPSPNYRFPVGPKKSGFGLIWDSYGKDAIRSCLSRRKFIFTEDQIDAIWETIRRSVVVSIDVDDNGEGRAYYMNNGVYREVTLARMIKAMGPTWMETPSTFEMEHFEKAVRLAQAFLIREIMRAYSVEACRKEILEKVTQVTDGILFLDQFRPWIPVFSGARDETAHIQLVIFPANGDWMIQSPYGNRGEPKLRTELPGATLGGKSAEELEEKTGIKGVTFVHPGGFIAGAKTPEAAKAFARYIIDLKQAAQAEPAV